MKLVGLGGEAVGARTAEKGRLERLAADVIKNVGRLCKLVR